MLLLLRHGACFVNLRADRVAIQEEDACQRRSKKTLFSGALRRHIEAEQQLAPGKRTTVHRGCHTGKNKEACTATSLTDPDTGDSFRNAK